MIMLWIKSRLISPWMRIIVPLGGRSSMLSIRDDEASFLPFAFLPDVMAKDGTGTDGPPAYNCRKSHLASEDSCSRAYQDLLS